MTMNYDDLLAREVRIWSPHERETSADARFHDAMANRTGSSGKSAKADAAVIATDSLIATDASIANERDEPANIVRVNGVKIPARDINIESANYEGGTIVERQRQAGVALVIRELLLQRAAQLQLPGLGSGLDEDGVIDQLLEREVALPQPDEAACRRYFDNHPENFRSADLFEAAHILIAADPRDDEAREQAKTRAAEAIRLLEKDITRFAKLAADWSDCPSKSDGGRLGQVGRGQTVAEFEDVMFRMQQGELSHSPVESRYGFHVIHVLHRVDGVPLSFEGVQQKIADHLHECVHRQAISQYLGILIGAAEISGIDLTGSETLLVQ